MSDTPKETEDEVPFPPPNPIEGVGMVGYPLGFDWATHQMADGKVVVTLIAHTLFGQFVFPMSADFVGNKLKPMMEAMFDAAGERKPLIAKPTLVIPGH